MIYFIIKRLEPNTAVANHFLGIVQGFIDSKTPYTIVVRKPRKKLLDYDGIERYNVKCLWGPRTGVGLIDNILYYVYRIFSDFSFFCFSRSLDKNKDSVFVYGQSEIIAQLVSTGCKIYQEITEHPDVLGFKISKVRECYMTSLKKVAGLFVISTSLKHFYIEQGVSLQKIHTINMIVNPDRFKGIERCVTDRYVAYCGNMSNSKDGVDLLIKSFAKIASKHPDVQLKIIGKKTTNDSSNSNIKLIKDLGLENRVVFTGMVSFRDIPQLLANASVLALARPNSLQAENGFPTKLGEYLLSGTPVVVTKTGDIPLFLKDGESAYLVEPDDIDGFASKLNYVLTNTAESNRIGKAGTEVALKHFNAHIESQKVVNILKNKVQ